MNRNTKRNKKADEYSGRKLIYRLALRQHSEQVFVNTPLLECNVDNRHSQDIIRSLHQPVQIIYDILGRATRRDHILLNIYCPKV